MQNAQILPRPLLITYKMPDSVRFHETMYIIIRKGVHI